ncbi:ABC transporter permease [Terrihabitans soli]|uniref:ABC transporter permease n=1 Tax=Terrihabitans soli TaxID=708113 RepID=A0A6S6QYH1_9HYPH|nr:ABC transporter permease [Terrihabitans soli]BCJ92322.1 ABC transporter permease [Terrihabitans soli]
MRRAINLKPERGTATLLALLPFALLILIYLVASAERLADNPDDKILPAFVDFGSAIVRLGFQPDTRSGDYLLWTDTFASLRRLGIALGISTLLGLVVGVGIGLLPYLRAGIGALVAVFSMVPPMAVLPILFIMFGLDEVSKIVLIVIGVAPFLIRDIAARVEEMPNELLIKAQTLGASTWQIVTRVTVPQILPRLIDSVRLQLGPAWLFLIAAEAIASTEGLGYRIFLVRRYLAMDVILPYVAWITLLAFLMDWGLRKLNSKAFPWMYRRAG